MAFTGPFTSAHWDELTGRGYTIVSGAVGGPRLAAAQQAAQELADAFPEGWERSKNELWREVKNSGHSAFVGIATDVLDPLAGEILESVQAPDRIQFAQTLPGFSTTGIIGRHFHIDGGLGPSLAVFNILFGVALSDVASDTAGGFHVLPGSHDGFARFFREQPAGAPIHWGEIKQAAQKKVHASLGAGARMVVPKMKAGDVIVAHSFLAHGTSANTTDKRRDMFFQRRAAKPLTDPATQEAARAAFMRDHWSFFRKHPPPHSHGEVSAQRTEGS
ncbi:MAG: phytanoyl-CoA dioxygenase family protein [Alphaproteobacteria bacterium]|nr:phytanoyl-CoA dioxygenase family protein [Alphaproteobacteria bacterium]